MLAGIGNIQTAGHNPDSSTASFDCSLVGGPINSHRQAADNGYASQSEFARKTVCYQPPIWRAAAGAHNGHGAIVLLLQPASHI